MQISWSDFWAQMPHVLLISLIRVSLTNKAVTSGWLVAGEPTSSLWRVSTLNGRSLYSTCYEPWWAPPSLMVFAVSSKPLWILPFVANASILFNNYCQDNDNKTVIALLDHAPGTVLELDTRAQWGEHCHCPHFQMGQLRLWEAKQNSTPGHLSTECELLTTTR